MGSSVLGSVTIYPHEPVLFLFLCVSVSLEDLISFTFEDLIQRAPFRPLSSPRMTKYYMPRISITVSVGKDKLYCSTSTDGLMKSYIPGRTLATARTLIQSQNTRLSPLPAAESHLTPRSLQAHWVLLAADGRVSHLGGWWRETQLITSVFMADSILSPVVSVEGEED